MFHVSRVNRSASKFAASYITPTTSCQNSRAVVTDCSGVGSNLQGRGGGNLASFYE